MLIHLLTDVINAFISYMNIFLGDLHSRNIINVGTYIDIIVRKSLILWRIQIEMFIDAKINNQIYAFVYSVLSELNRRGIEASASMTVK